VAQVDIRHCTANISTCGIKGTFGDTETDAALKFQVFFVIEIVLSVLSASCCKYGQDLHFLRHFNQEFRITVEMMREVRIATAVASHRLDA
jgi:hypothetical protein